MGAFCKGLWTQKKNRVQKTTCRAPFLNVTHGQNAKGRSCLSIILRVEGGIRGGILQDPIGGTISVLEEV